MKELMMNEDFADVTLVTEDKKQIKANTNILSACSPVFKDILKKEKNSTQVMYLRGIQFPEMESIMQFIYIGEATFSEERMDEFLAVAKSLEIKELCISVPATKYEPDDKPLPCAFVRPTEKLEDQTIISDQINRQAPLERRRQAVQTNDKYECEQCHKIYHNSSHLRRHKLSVHEGVNYACNQCDYEATQQPHLVQHIKSKHEGVKYVCGQCEFQGTTQGHLKLHIQNKHEGIKYACVQCDQQYTQKFNLRTHIKNKHEA